MHERPIDRYGKTAVYIAAALFILIVLCCVCCCLIYALTFAAMQAGVITPIP